MPDCARVFNLDDARSWGIVDPGISALMHNAIDAGDADAWTHRCGFVVFATVVQRPGGFDDLRSAEVDRKHCRALRAFRQERRAHCR